MDSKPTYQDFVKALEELNDQFTQPVMKNPGLNIYVSPDEYARHGGDVNSYLNEKIRGIAPRPPANGISFDRLYVDQDYFLQKSIRELKFPSINPQ